MELNPRLPGMPACLVMILLSMCVLGCKKEVPVLRVAVAANFLSTAEALVLDYGKPDIEVHAGSTGQLYAQIINGAPYDVFLSADEERPRLLEESGLGRERFTYALGQLAMIGDLEKLKQGKYARVAIAQPDLAPYGYAAREVLETIGLVESMNEALVKAENVGQVLSYLRSGNVKCGFLAKSQLTKSDEAWIVPVSYYKPIRQQAVIVKPSEEALDFIQYLKSEEAREVMKKRGYGLE